MGVAAFCPLKRFPCRSTYTRRNKLPECKFRPESKVLETVPLNTGLGLDGK